MHCSAKCTFKGDGRNVMRFFSIRQSEKKKKAAHTGGKEWGIRLDMEKLRKHLSKGENDNSLTFLAV